MSVRLYRRSKHRTQTNLLQANVVSYDTTNLPHKLFCEELKFLFQLVDLLGLVRQHILEGVVLIVSLALIELDFMRNPPFLTVALSKEFCLLVVQPFCFTRK